MSLQMNLADHSMDIEYFKDLVVSLKAQMQYISDEMVQLQGTEDCKELNKWRCKFQHTVYEHAAAQEELNMLEEDNNHLSDHILDTGLFEAIKAKDIETTRYLCNKGCNVNAVDSNNLSAVYHAVENGFIEGLHILGHYGASMNSSNYGFAREEHFCSTADVCSPLHLAVRNGDIDMCQILMSYGADVDTKDPCDEGKTPLLCAITNRKFKVAEWLLQHGANPHIVGDFNLCVIPETIFRRSLRTLYALRKAGVQFNTHYHGDEKCEPLADTVLPQYALISDNVLLNDTASDSIALQMAKFFVSQRCDKVTFLHCKPCEADGQPPVKWVAEYLHNIGCDCGDVIGWCVCIPELLCTYRKNLQQESQVLTHRGPLQNMCRQAIRTTLSANNPKSTYMTSIKDLPIPKHIQEWIVYGESINY